MMQPNMLYEVFKKIDVGRKYNANKSLIQALVKKKS